VAWPAKRDGRLLERWNEIMLLDTVTNAASLIAGLVCAALFVHHVRKEPRRILNGILLVLAMYFTVNGGMRLYAPNQYELDGSLALGGGEEALLGITFLFLILCFLMGIALCVNGAMVIRREGWSLALALPLIFGAAGIAYPLLFLFSVFLATHRALFLLSGIMQDMLLYVPGMLAAFLLYSFVYAALTKPKDCDFLLVLGAGLRKGETVTPLLADRLDRAIRFDEAGGRKAAFVVSGGKGADERVSEAFAMKQYLLARGVHETRIIMEDRSKNTYENTLFSKEIMEEINPTYRCMIVTSNYHVLRAVILAKNVGLNAQGIGGKTALYYLPAAFIREYIAIIFTYKGLVAAYVAAVALMQIVRFLL
jgi:uncharacterized SAM-binding protein YcdF (DUF218 family)